MEISNLHTGPRPQARRLGVPAKARLEPRRWNPRGRSHDGENLSGSSGTQFASWALSSRHDSRPTAPPQQSSRFVTPVRARRTMHCGAPAAFALYAARSRTIRGSGRRPDATIGAAVTAAAPTPTAQSSGTAIPIAPTAVRPPGAARDAAVRPGNPGKRPIAEPAARECPIAEPAARGRPAAPAEHRVAASWLTPHDRQKGATRQRCRP